MKAKLAFSFQAETGVANFGEKRFTYEVILSKCQIICQQENPHLMWKIFHAKVEARTSKHRRKCTMSIGATSRLTSAAFKRAGT